MFKRKVNSIKIQNQSFIKFILLADDAKAKGEVHTSTTGTAHNVSASNDSNAPHGNTTTAKVEVKTTSTNKPPLV